jgi:acetyl-CoA carboxylase biotin carboxylase subunit
MRRETMNSKDALKYYASQVEEIKEAGLLKGELPIASAQSAHVTLSDGRELLCMCANNYLGLADSPRLIEAAKRTYDERGYGSRPRRNYNSVGTVEFLYDKDGNFYFMEMNTRLQVEHGVSEMVTGMDIVQWQIRVAAGIELNRRQEDVYFHGHAIECRINAEDPDNNYRPSCGKITGIHVPGGSFVRFDTALYQDYVIPPFYDSMIGKVIVQGRTRELAVRKMKMALSELSILGVKINRDLMIDILSEDEFLDGSYTTDFMEGFESRKEASKK